MKTVLVITAYTDALTNNEYFALPMHFRKLRLLSNHKLNSLKMTQSSSQHARAALLYMADQETNFQETNSQKMLMLPRQ